MSKCHFPQDNFTIILDLPSISHIQMRLIETDNHLPPASFASLSCFNFPQPSTQLLHDSLQDEDSLGLMIQPSQEEPSQRNSKKKTGCTCKKTNCIKMYCQCFSVGKECTPQCACFGCYNHGDHENLPQKIKQRSLHSNRHHSRGCNCKKTNCQKKYCECYNAGLPCTELCNCCDCCNKDEEASQNSSQSREVHSHRCK